MALEEYDDYEQEQIVKEWLGNNWLTILAGIAIGIGGLWGFNKWQNTQAIQSSEAASQFSQLKAAIELSEPSEIDQLITDYEGDFGQNIFLIEARMQAANKAVNAEDFTAAKSQYQALIAAKPDKPIAELARIRLARLMVSDGDYDTAKSELGLVQSTAYKTVVEEVLGDIYLAQGELSKAQDSYQLALNEGEGYSGKQIVEMKLADSKSNN